MMTFVLRRIVWSDGCSRPDDYDVIHEETIVGRIYRMRSTGQEHWRWTQIGLRASTDGANGGGADSLDQAKAAFRAAWERWEHGL